MIIYESKTLKVEVDNGGVLKVEEAGRKLNIDLKPLVRNEDNKSN